MDSFDEFMAANPQLRELVEPLAEIRMAIESGYHALYPKAKISDRFIEEVMRSRRVDAVCIECKGECKKPGGVAGYKSEVYVDSYNCLATRLIKCRYYGGKNG